MKLTTKVAFVSGPISPYQARLFNGLAEHLDITVYRNLPDAPFQQWNVPEPQHDVVDLPILWRNGLEVVNKRTVKMLSDGGYSTVVACGHHLPAFWAVSSKRLACERRILWTEQPAIPVLDWPPRSINSSMIRKPLREFALRMTTRRLDNIWAIGDGCAEYFETRYSIPTRVVTYFADTTPLMTSRRAASQVEVAFVGQLSERKGALLLPALYEALQRRYGDSFRLTVAGAGPYEADVKQLLDDKNNVHFVGHIDHDAVIELLGQTDIFLAPAIHDGWGLHVIEALSQGCYVISTVQTSSAKTCLTTSDLGVLFDYHSGVDPDLLESLPELEELRSGFTQRVNASLPYLLEAGITQVSTLLNAGPVESTTHRARTSNE